MTNMEGLMRSVVESLAPLDRSLVLIDHVANVLAWGAGLEALTGEYKLT
jgi:hypothetical protein